MPTILALDINSSCHWRKDWPASPEKGGSESNDLFDLKLGIEPPEVGGSDWHELGKQLRCAPPARSPRGGPRGVDLRVLLLRSVVVRILAALIRGRLLAALLLFVPSTFIVAALVCCLLLLCLEQMQKSGNL